MASTIHGVEPETGGNEPLKFISKEEAKELEKELYEEYRFGQQQLIEIAGYSCAMAITKAYPRVSLHRKQPTILVICGQEQNGAIGLVCARHLRTFGYEPTIYYPKRSCKSIFLDFTVQCEKLDIPFLSYLPNEVQLINDAYNLIIDAVLGLSDEAGLKELYCNILSTMKHVKIPVISIDVPSGWDVENGKGDGISPEVLISLVAPKKCATQFSGKYHFLAGRYLPYDLQKKYDLNLPDYPGTDCIVQL
ncbi:yjeF N-terminal domain-containing 3 [Hypanus sabinus]|uniref:yjeF N-terminal domain-containing 3 n=1 Tax=Hypanus sabinus TaxID=79690 RepID=UPI0028C46819|nr:yjeF N-terminal domain-containing 3 [Hypanus sabinus]